MCSSAKNLQKIFSSEEIRKIFIDYFILNHDHRFVRSSPVVPFCDPTVAFVNAGMNQFKSIFLGKKQAIQRRVCNSQKCIRVGGKHNDLSIVGRDGYHHTFFEMLGNWSFGDYFKYEACKMAVDLLKGPFEIDPHRLYITYFAGDSALGLPPDVETLEIWRSLGFPASRILPFASKDNFWEMGPTGPCGPCTEIHIDHHREGAVDGSRAKFVNAGCSDLTELWNIVFMQYNRNADGSIAPLADHHVDTGMGFERLTAILQGKFSNYDTDLFTPIFDSIQKESKVPDYGGSFPAANGDFTLDTGYRILGDHARMVAICLADGMLPDQNQKLRRILRRALTISEEMFGSEQLFSHIMPVVVETLGTAYPELEAKQDSLLELIEHEREVFKELKSSSYKAFSKIYSDLPKLEYMDLMECPGFAPAYREFRTQKCAFQNNIIPGNFLYKLTDTYGLTENYLQRLAEIEKMSLDEEGYKEAMRQAKLKARSALMDKKTDHCENSSVQTQVDDLLATVTKTLLPTDDSHKYNSTGDRIEDRYTAPNVRTKVLAIVLMDAQVDKLHCTAAMSPHNTIYIVTDRSCFHPKSVGQQSDKGLLSIVSNRGTVYDLSVVDVISLNDCSIHVCRPQRTVENGAIFTLAVGDEVQLKVDAEHRKAISCHQTGVHLLHESVGQHCEKTIYLVSSEVTADHFKIEVGVIGKQLNKNDIVNIESFISRIISASCPVHVQIISPEDVTQQGDITIMPGEVYPEMNLRLLTISCDPLRFRSKNLCCGAHALNTADLECLSITNVKQTSRSRYMITGVAGTGAKNILMSAALLSERINALEKKFQLETLTCDVGEDLQNIRTKILNSNILLPHIFKMDAVESINEMLRKLKENSRATLKEIVEYEIKTLLSEKPMASHPFIVHYISSSALLEEVPLQKATRHCTDRPILVVSICDDVIKARSCVPKAFLTKDFTAELWLKELAAVFKGQVAPPKGQNPHEVCNMKGKRIPIDFDNQLRVALERANKFADKFVVHKK